MTDGSLPDRLTQLRGRWEADPASRIFLQLAEEYRHQGRLHEALGVLDEGLKEHPGYLSALVAKGRCLLELGQPEPAREVLERVVRQDATQMVANKLLVRTYLETGQAVRARERLDLYSLLHDGDPEVEDLRARIQRLDGASAAASHAAAAPERADPDPSPQTMANMAPTPPQDDVFDLGAPPAAPSPKAEDVFDLPHPAAGSAPAPAAASSAPAAPPPDESEPEPVAPGEPFAGLVSPAVRRRYLEALAAEGIFAFELPASWAPAASAVAPVSPPATLPTAPPIAAPAAPEPAVEPPPAASSEPPAAPEPAEPAAAATTATADWAAGAGVATVTLGELYLRQGHAGEAERIFGEVLGREPDNAAAHEGLERARTLSSPLPPPEPVPVGRRTKTIQMLNGYLDRIRGRSARHVS